MSTSTFDSAAQRAFDVAESLLHRLTLPSAMPAAMPAKFDVWSYTYSTGTLERVGVNDDPADAAALAWEYTNEAGFGFAVPSVDSDTAQGLFKAFIGAGDYCRKMLEEADQPKAKKPTKTATKRSTPK